MQDTEVSFSNVEIPLDALPRFDAVPLNPVAPNYLPYALVSALWFWPLLGLISLAVRHQTWVNFNPDWRISAALFAFTIPGLLHAWLDARRRGWALREHDLIYRAGVWWRKTVILPFARIQHVETASGPLERAFGLMRVKCFTAGGLSADLQLLGLSADDARRVRQFLLEQISDDAPEETGDDEPAG